MTDDQELGNGTRTKTNAPAVPDEAAGDESAPSLANPSAEKPPAESGVEVEVWTGRTHWKHFAGRIILWAAANVAFMLLVATAASRTEWLAFRGASWSAVGVLVVSGLLVLGRVAVTVLSRRYRITSQRLFIERGILRQTIDQTELVRVDDVRVHKTVLDRVFGLGSVEVVSTDASDKEVVLDGIADPDTVAEGVRTHMRALRRSSLFIENL
ncbi:MAG: PH domain-containing protein [Phycisphaerales bacterium]|nr:MAG: PH domain-containing protein [Phycisphaerales bacterium]